MSIGLGKRIKKRAVKYKWTEQPTSTAN
jgi:hypothetical protein